MRMRMVAAAAFTLSVGGCAAGMGGMMAGGGMHDSGVGETVADAALYAPDRLLMQADVLRLTAEQVVALQGVRDSLRAGQANANAAAGAAREMLTTRQRQFVERRGAPATPAAPAHRHDD